ncbi:UvrD-helicase domain-containing protein [Alicyclobacillus macrosporangiidus]|uniref:DNA 3'-5' helicase n=1 Tax=Alicyclobacillus macrosporangiidus TaxID=392015 RepID=A0A1I7L338_9BACL|nr:UvrD-helicase domain-containing protein [Alicyclobacillus macrosporangiidus]SFV04192.1 ATP-dependent helicase/nuclease subunit A [Alicyclobacillus macrosporangiidus]
MSSPRETCGTDPQLEARWSARQREAILTRGQNVLVSAGAGSGKTSVLVERVVQRVTWPGALDLDRLLMVTFTEAAAAEMRHRIAGRLEALAKEAAARGDAAAVRQAHRQLNLLDRAQISTLHSFCMEVVRRNFLTLGLEPAFDILPEDERTPLRARVFEELVEAWLSGGRAEEVRCVARILCADDLEGLWPLVDRLDTFAQSQPNPADWLGAVRRMYEEADAVETARWPWTPAFLQWAARQVEEAAEMFSEALRMTTGWPELEAYGRDLAHARALAGEAAGRLGSWAGVPEAVRCLGAIFSGKRVSAPNRPEFKAVKDLRTKGRNRIQAVLDILSRGEAGLRADVARLAPAVTALVDLTAAFADHYDAAKRRRGVLDFSDLEQFAHRVLRDPATGEARRLQAQYAEIFVDEYQDTSPIQDAIVTAIARPHGNVFVVGDVKQSIYRFRMAEPQLFLERYRGQAGGRVIDLTDNYRSRAEVVDAVNFFFSQFFSPPFGGIDYGDGGAMNAAAPYPADGGEGTLAGPVEVHLVERQDAAQADGSAGGSQGEEHGAPEADLSDRSLPGAGEGEGEAGDESAEETGGEGDLEAMMEELSHLEKEALVVARRIQELLGRVPGCAAAEVWDRDEGRYRPLRCRDIVVLLRAARVKVNVFLEVFAQAGIPAYGATSVGFYGALEVQWLLAALTVIDNPRHDLDFVTLLRSPIGGFQDDELARIRLLGRGMFYDAWRRAAAGRVEAWAEVADTGAAGWQERLVAKVRAFHDRLSEWRALARRATAEAVLRRILEDTGFLAFVSGMPGGPGRRANVEALLGKARAYDRRYPDGVFGFIRRAKEALERDVDEGEARTLGESEDVVRVMTIHQSKGLEYPVVFVADLGKQFRVDTNLPLHRTLGVGPVMVDVDTEQRWLTLPSIAIQELELTQTLAEEARVLYVAMTRARERLILVGSGKDLAKQAARWVPLAQSDAMALPLYGMLRAKSYLDWIGPALLRHRDGGPLRRLAEEAGMAAAWHPGPVYDHPAGFTVTLWNTAAGRRLPWPSAGVAETAAEPAGGCPFRPEVFASGDTARIRAHLAELAQLTEPAGLPGQGNVGQRDGQTALAQQAAAAEDAASSGALSSEPWPDGLTLWKPDVARTPLPGKVSATDLRRIWAHHLRRTDPQGVPEAAVHPSAAAHLLDDPAFHRPDAVTPRERGVLFHALMQRLDFAAEPSRRVVEAALDEMVRTGILTERERDPALVEDAWAFLASPLGRRLARARRVWREQPFFYRIPVSEPAPAGGRLGPADSADSRFVVVQGVIDCLAEEEDGWLIIDYKTDRIGARALEAQAREYEAQVAAYVEAVRTALGDGRVEAYLYFVHPRAAVQVDGVPLRRVIDALVQTPGTPEG